MPVRHNGFQYLEGVARLFHISPPSNNGYIFLEGLSELFNEEHVENVSNVPAIVHQQPIMPMPIPALFFNNVQHHDMSQESGIFNDFEEQE